MPQEKQLNIFLGSLTRSSTDLEPETAPFVAVISPLAVVSSRAAAGLMSLLV